MTQQPSRNDTIEDFTAALVRSELAAESDVRALAERYRDTYLPIANLPDTITAFCNFLVVEGILTPWQVDKLRRGKWKGFFLDGYEFKDLLGKDSEYSYFLARNTQTGQFVVLAVTPLVRSEGPDIQYRVDHLWD